MAHSLIVCQEGSKSGRRKMSTISRIWYETIPAIAPHAAVIEIGADVCVSDSVVI